MLEIKVCDMRAAGKSGYVAKILPDGSRVFLMSHSQDDYTTSAKEVVYLIDVDGIYEICDANFGSRKRRLEYIKVENGEIIIESDNLNDIILADIKLPEIINGNEKQLIWSSSIRSKYIVSLIQQKKEIPEWVYKEIDAKVWIDKKIKNII